MRSLSIGGAVLALVLARPAEGQRPVLVVAGGAGIVLRDERHATVGFHLAISSHWSVRRGVLVGVEVMGESYPPWQFSGDLCPPGGCAPEREDRTMVGGLLLTGIVRHEPSDPKSGNPIYPIFGAALYGVHEDSETRISPGLTGGLGIPLADHVLVEARIHWVANDSRVNAFLPLSLLWAF